MLKYEKRSTIFKRKIDAILHEHNSNIMGIVYVFDQTKCWQKDYVGVVRVIFETCKMIRTEPKYVDLCEFHWRHVLYPLTTNYCMYSERNNLITVAYENINQALDSMKECFPQYPAGVPSKFVNNYPKGFRALTHLVVDEDAHINELFKRFFEPVPHREGIVIRSNEYGKVFTSSDASRLNAVRSGN